MPSSFQFISGTPRLILRLEGLGVGLSALVAYGYSGQSWWLFAALVLVPDIAMIGYLYGSRTGAFAYNLAHAYLVPILLFGLSCLIGSAMFQAVAIIWLAHIGFDRALGYGLKYSSGFRDTHLGPLGRAGDKR